MPVNKDALGRYRIINRLIVNRKYVSKQEIIDTCRDELGYEVSQRTIEGDIKQMKTNRALGYYAPIEFCHQHKGYYYKDKNYSIDKIPINKDELDAISFCIKLLSQFRGTTFYSDMELAIEKLNIALQINKNNNNFQKPDFIEIEEAPHVKGMEHLSEIIEAIKNKRVLKINYCKFISDKEESHIISPFYLKEYQNRWYVMGWHHDYNAYRTYGLDRINKINTLHTHKFHNTDFDAKNYFKNVIGITAPENQKIEQIALKVTTLQSKYLASKPLHHSQKIESLTDTHSIIHLTLIPTYEFYAQVLSFGDAIEILSPNNIRQHITKILHNAAQLYTT